MSYTYEHLVRQRNFLLELLQGTRRDELPPVLATYFSEVVECKYPTKAQLLEAVDHCLQSPSPTPSATSPTATTPRLARPVTLRQHVESAIRSPGSTTG